MLVVSHNARGFDMPKLDPQLHLSRCPHCNVNNPNLAEVHRCETHDHSGQVLRRWRIYKCVNCGNLVTAWAMNFGQEAVQIFPETQSLDETIPERPRAYLHQAIESLHSPAGAVMLAASAVDSMLKLKGYKGGNEGHIPYFLTLKGEGKGLLKY